MAPKNPHRKSVQQAQEPNKGGSRSSQSDAVLRSAHAYLRRGYSIVPIPKGHNHPKLRGWQKLRIPESKLRSYFSASDGIGLLLQPSKLTDVDLDSPEPVTAAKTLQPPTSMIHGRRGNPFSHHYYDAVPVPQNKSFYDPRIAQGASNRAVLVEVRTNGYTMAPPSLHPKTGERIRWESVGKPARCDGE